MPPPEQPRGHRRFTGLDIPLQINRAPAQRRQRDGHKTLVIGALRLGVLLGADVLEGQRRAGLVARAGQTARYGHDRVHRERIGIEHHIGAAARYALPFLPAGDRARVERPAVLRVDVPRNALERGVQHVAAQLERLAVQFARVLIGRLDGAAAHDIVELIEHHVRPRRPELVGIVLQIHQRHRRGHPLFGGQQAVLGAAVVALDRAAGAVTADGVMLEIALHRQMQRVVLLHIVEIVAGLTEAQVFVPLGIAHHGAQIGNGRAAAVVAHAVEQHIRLVLFLDAPGQHVQPPAQLAVAPVAAIGEGNAEHWNARAVHALPDKRVGVQRLFVLAGAHHDVARHPRERKQLRNHAVMAEAVHVVAELRARAECLFIIALAVERMPRERFAAGRVAVGLKPPAARDHPAALLNAAPDLLEHRRLVFLNPLIIARARAGEYEIVEFVHAVERRAERRLDLGEALLPAPQPDRIDMRVADKPDRVLHRLNHAFQKALLGRTVYCFHARTPPRCATRS